MSGAHDELVFAGRGPVPRRRLVIVLTVLLAVTAVALLLDHRRRDREAADVASCRRLATETIAAVSRPVWSRTALIRPVLPGADEAVRRDLYTLLSDSAAGADERLLAARRGCDVGVLWFHEDVRRRRDACLAELDAQVRWWRAVAADGRNTFRPHPPRGGCG